MSLSTNCKETEILSVKLMTSIRDLLKDVDGEKRYKEPLSLHTSFRVGGNADVLFFPKDQGSLVLAVRIACENGIPIFILGNGSNLLVRDGGIKGIVISLKKMEGAIEINSGTRETVLVVSPAGTSMPRLVRHTVDKGLEGIETLIGVPGTLGGALKINAGAEGKEIGGIFHSLRMLNMKGEVKEFMKNEIRFNYRETEFPIKGIFLEATLELKKGNKDVLSQKVKRLLEKRSASQPISQKGAGSIFKNPKGHYAGQLIEEAGLKSLSIGDAEVSPKHANFIINRGKAKSKDIEELIKVIQEKVMVKAGIFLKPEIEITGEH
jgi:UDP-N-acetylmuramate dehydrogenase